MPLIIIITPQIPGPGESIRGEYKFPFRIPYEKVNTLTLVGPTGSWNTFSRGCIRDNIDMVGGDLRSFMTKNKNIDECKKACLANKNCVAFTMNKNNGQCWIKHTGHRAASFNAARETGLKSCYIGGGPAPTLGGGNFRLLSHRRRATQSSTGWSGRASRAVDGNTDGIYNRK